MKKNIGSNDALTRIIIALVFIALWGFKIITGLFAIVLLVLGGIFVITAVVDYCPLYATVGINSCKKEEN